MKKMKKISIKPILAKESLVKKYIKIIDKNRYYSNFGPLYFKVKKKLKEILKIPQKELVLTSSCDASIYACCLLLRQTTKKKIIVVPSFSFSSNPQSIIRAGFIPFFVDIDEKNFFLQEEKINLVFKKHKKDIAAIMYVSPIGKPLNINYLNSIKKKYKTEIIYDAADTFINLGKDLNKTNFLITGSFHPTKNLPANESGFIICNKQNEEELKKIINFGQEEIKNLRYIKTIGFNGKFSEYDAAILLANISKIKNLKKKLKINNSYFSNLNSENTNSKTIEGFGKNWFSTKLCIFCKNKSFKKIHFEMLKFNIQIFSPWGLIPMHKQKQFKFYKKTSMTNTDKIVKNFFAIPLNYDIKLKEIKRIKEALKKICY